MYLTFLGWGLNSVLKKPRSSGLDSREASFILPHCMRPLLSLPREAVSDCVPWTEFYVHIFCSRLR